jgi:hypothetical protein
MASYQRLLAVTGWLLILGAAAVVLVRYAPLPRVATVVRLWTEDSCRHCAHPQRLAPRNRRSRPSTDALRPEPT